MPETKPAGDPQQHRPAALHPHLLHGLPVTEPLSREPRIHHGRLPLPQALLQDGQPPSRQPRLAIVRGMRLRADALASSN